MGPSVPSTNQVQPESILGPDETQTAPLNATHEQMLPKVTPVEGSAGFADDEKKEQ